MLYSEFPLPLQILPAIAREGIARHFTGSVRTDYQGTFFSLLEVQLLGGDEWLALTNLAIHFLRIYPDKNRKNLVGGNICFSSLPIFLKLNWNQLFLWNSRA